MFPVYWYTAAVKIAVGSVSEQKLGYVEKILQEIGLAAELLPAAVPSGVVEQPLTGEATETGAKNRAQGALEQTPEADFALGIEVGYHQNERGNFEIFCCAAVCDHGGFAETCFSSRFLLPEFHQKVLELYISERRRQQCLGIS